MLDFSLWSQSAFIAFIYLFDDDNNNEIKRNVGILLWIFSLIEYKATDLLSRNQYVWVNEIILVRIIEISESTKQIRWILGNIELWFFEQLPKLFTVTDKPNMPWNVTSTFLALSEKNWTVANYLNKRRRHEQ